MEVKVFDTSVEASQYAYDLIVQAKQNGAQVFGLATGSTPENLYQLLSESDLDFSQAISINLDEYFGLSPEHPQSYAYFMQEHLLQAKPFKKSYLPDGKAEDIDAELKRYDQVIAKHPIDLQLLGLGGNGHIGFNEPGTPFDSQTQFVKLTDSTIEANQRFFSEKEEVPRQALSMGIGTIMQAKQIILMAFGKGKAEAVKAMIQGPATEATPASVLQKHPNAKILLDREAAQLLES